MDLNLFKQTEIKRVQLAQQTLRRQKLAQEKRLKAAAQLESNAKKVLQQRKKSRQAVNKNIRSKSTRSLQKKAQTLKQTKAPPSAKPSQKKWQKQEVQTPPRPPTALPRQTQLSSSPKQQVIRSPPRIAMQMKEGKQQYQDSLQYPLPLQKQVPQAHQVLDSIIQLQELLGLKSGMQDSLGTDWLKLIKQQQKSTAFQQQLRVLKQQYKQTQKETATFGKPQTTNLDSLQQLNRMLQINTKSIQLASNLQENCISFGNKNITVKACELKPQLTDSLSQPNQFVPKQPFESIKSSKDSSQFVSDKAKKQLSNLNQKIRKQKDKQQEGYYRRAQLKRNLIKQPQKPQQIESQSKLQRSLEKLQVKLARLRQI